MMRIMNSSFWQIWGLYLVLFTIWEVTGVALGAFHGRGYSMSMRGLQGVAGIRDGKFDFADPAFDGIGNGATISAWIKHHNTQRPGVVWRWASTSDNYLLDCQFDWMWASHSDGVWHFNELEDITPLEEWAHYAVVVDGDQISSYVNGKFVLSTDIAGYSLALEGTTFYLGGLFYTGGPISGQVRVNLEAPFSGEIDDLMIWKRALNATEMATLMDYQPDLSDVPADLPMYYNFDVRGCASTMAVDGLYDSSCMFSGDGVVKNLGHAGSSYDLLVGGLNDDFGYGLQYVDKNAPDKDKYLFDTPRVSLSSAPIPSAHINSTKFSPFSPWVFQVLDGENITIPMPVDNVSDLQVLEAPMLGEILRSSDESDATSDFASLLGESSIQFRVPENFTTPIWFKLFGNGTEQEVHIWPYGKPKLTKRIENTMLYKVFTVEGEASTLYLGNMYNVEPAEALDVEIISLPSNGKLALLQTGFAGWSFSERLCFQDDSCVQVNETGQLLPYSSGLVVKYDPNAHYEGYDSFEVQFVSSMSGKRSDVVLVKIFVEGYDDLPTATGTSSIVLEDDETGIEIDLIGGDLENTFGHSFLITELPSKGDLFIEMPGRNGETQLQKVTTEYHIFDVGHVTEQYASGVVGVSSFKDHPFGLLGRPSCYKPGRDSSFSECRDNRLSEDPTFLPYEGLLVHVNRFMGFQNTTSLSMLGRIVKATEPYSVELLPIYRYKTNTSMEVVPCMYEPSNKTTYAYPDDCTEAEALKYPNGIIISNLTRQNLTAAETKYSPAFMDYRETNIIPDNREGVFYGARFQTANYSQKENYENYGFTEYVEVTFDAEVHPIGVEVGMPRGGGSIVSIKAQTPSGSWRHVYKAKALRAKYEEVSDKGFYFLFTESICRTNFKTSKLRIELDTSAETGTGDWNYIDYVLLIGTVPKTYQSGVLRYNSSKVHYIPYPNAFGMDRFTFAVSDCEGNRLRASETASVDIEISAQPDPPVLEISGDLPVVKCGVPDSEAVTISYEAMAVDGVGLTVYVVQPPEFGLIKDQALGEPMGSASPSEQTNETFSQVFQFQYLALCNILEKTISDSVTLEVVDSNGLSAQLDITITVLKEDRQLAKPGTLMVCNLMFGVNIFITSIALIFVLKNRKSAIVKASQFEFLVMVCVGSFISTSTILPILVDDTSGQETADFACQAQVWLYCLGFTLTIVPLALKLYRTFLMFDESFGAELTFGTADQRRRRKMQISSKMLYLKIFAIILGDLILVIVWTLDDPLKYVRTVDIHDLQYNYPLQSSGTCWSERMGIHIGLIATYHFAVLAWVGWVAYKTLHINTAFSESKYIRFAVFSTAEFLLISIPILIITAENVNVSLFTRCAAVFINDFSVVMLLIFPKIMATIYPGYLSKDGLGAELITSLVQQQNTKTTLNGMTTKVIGDKNESEEKTEYLSAASPGGFMARGFIQSQLGSKVSPGQQYRDSSVLRTSAEQR